jgi:phage tail P2-like protein
MSTSIDDVSLSEYLTPAARNDLFFYCAALTLDPLLADIRGQIINNNVLPRLQNQSSQILDVLAHYHFNLDVYDDNLDFGKKLILVRDAIKNKIRKGTPSAIKNVMNTVFNYVELIEWWQDSPPAPHDTFRLKISDPLVDGAKVQSMIKTILAVKNARSYFAGITSFGIVPAATVYTGGLVGLYDYRVISYRPTIL